jgi:hypothetical protein
LNQVNTFIHTLFLITKLYIISVSVSAYTSTNWIIPPSFIKIGKSFKSHPNTHAYSRHIAISFMCFQTGNRLVDLELKYYKTNIAVI